ncbi:MAG: ATPase domain-containing protein [Janthinobacterium lividum]
MTAPTLISTGIDGLDVILKGGLAPNRMYLVAGAPGAGKTTLALQFLLQGRDRGERGLYVTLSETTEELVAVAASHGWTLDGIDLFELSAAEAALGGERETTLLHPWEIELGETVKLITDEAERTGASRIVFDSLSEMRLLAQDALRFRRQVLALKQFFAGQGATVLLLDDRVASAAGPDLQLHSLCHGVLSLERLTLDFGAARRRLEVAKMRGARYREGWHDYTIHPGGLEVFPRLVANEHNTPFVGDPVLSGLPALDALLGGGPLRGTCTLLSGPAGAGKSTLSLQYVHAAAERGERCAIYQFDERAGTLVTRSAKLGLDLQPHLDANRIILRQIDPAELSPGEFAHMLRLDVERNETRIVVIDSLSGYLMAMPQEKQLLLQLHELLSYLNQRGVLTLMINPQAGFLASMQSSISVSYIADTILVLRFFEAKGRVRKAISVIKNRGGRHEDTIRELRIDSEGVRVGDILAGFQGVLTGTPTYIGEAGPLLEALGTSNA